MKKTTFCCVVLDVHDAKDFLYLMQEWENVALFIL